MKKKLYTLLVLIPVFAACREDKLQDFEDPIGTVYFYIDEKKEVAAILYSIFYSIEDKVVVKVRTSFSG